MKIGSFFVFIAGLMLAVSARANDTRVLHYKASLVFQSQREMSCPRVTSLVAQQKPHSLDGEYLWLKSSEEKVVAALRFAFPSTTCISDMICITKNHYQNYREASVSLTRHNDGNYPTTDHPGYTELTILIPNMRTRITDSCVYMLHE